MSAYPLVLDGAALSALVVGGGKVAMRKVQALLASGAQVHVVAPNVLPELRELATSGGSLRVTVAAYSPACLGDARLVIAATDDDVVNARVAADGRTLGRLVNVVSDPELGNCQTPAVHRAGDVIIAVSAGRLPGAATRLRDRVASGIDHRYADAVSELSALRRALLGGGNRERWADAARALVGPRFCEEVESGVLAARIAEWR